jgi:superfamily II DNA or RNA helicase
MSLRVDKEFLSIRDINQIKNDCFVEGKENDYGPAEILRAYGETNTALYVPFAYAKTHFRQSPNKETMFPQTNYQFYLDKFPFRTDGGRDQEKVFNEAKGLIRKHRSALLSLFCGCGKTFLGIGLAQSSGLKCAILAHRGVLFDQWVDSIQKFTNAKVQQVDTDGELDPEADFYIFNIAFVHKRWQKSTKCWIPKKLGIYKDIIGMLIVDEAHIACASEMSRALLYFNPRVAVALTATPVRKDGMDKALELYFGKYDTTRIVRIATDPFTVYRLPTGVKPEFTRNAFGKKDWNSVIKYLVEDESRNKLIVKLVCKFKEYNILILTKRKAHCTLLSKELATLKITNTVMTGTTKKYDKSARVLLSTYSKLGVGFDDTRLNMLIVACSVTEVEQYAGRLRDGKGKKRVIIDLVDDDPNCLSHWSERRKWYISRNGNIKHYYREFPEEKPDGKKNPIQLAGNGKEETISSERPKRLARRIPEN